jgi:hypothetical protein
VFLTVVVLVWDVTPHSFAGTHRRFRGTCLHLKDRNDFTSQKTAVVGVVELTRADTFGRGNRVWKPTSPQPA